METKNKQITLLQGKVLLVELMEGVSNPRIWPESPDRLYVDDPLGYDGVDQIDLPPGNWRIIGMLSEVTEEQISDIIDSVSVICTDGTEYGGWRNYVCRDDFDETILLNTAIESLDSAIEVEGYRFTNPHGDLPSKTDMGHELSWDQAQPRVLDRSRCLLLGREG